MNAFETPCLLNGKPYNGPLPANAKYVGMEKEPNRPPRYGKLIHLWFNKPCYETEEGEGDD